MIRWITVGALAALAAGCGGSTASKGTYTLALTNFSFHEGQKVELHVKASPAATDFLGAEAYGNVTNGQLTLTVANVLEAGKTYTVDFYADVNGNGSYDAPVNGQFLDHSWRRTVQGNPAGVNETFAHDDNWTDISPFS